MNTRQEKVLKTLQELGGQATTYEIASKLGWSPITVSQILLHIENVKYLDKNVIPKTWQIKPNLTKIKHGSFSEESIFDIIQNKYLGAPNGYLELLTVNNSPTGKCNFIVHKAINYGQEGHFAELNSLEDAVEIFELARSINHIGWNKSPKIINFVIYGENESPWFYSQTEDFSK